MNQHTQGPWRLSTYPGMPGEGNKFNRDNDGSFRIVRGEGDELEPVATAIFKGTAKRGQAWQAEDPKGLANARLIASAPELLEAARRAALWMMGQARRDPEAREIVDLLSGAVAKAEGR